MESYIKYWFFCGSALAFSTVLGVCLVLVATSKVYPLITRSKKEKYFIDHKSGKLVEFPSISEKANINLSVIVPAYNEEVRCKYLKIINNETIRTLLSCVLVPPMLDECIEVLEGKSSISSSFRYEVIVVSDGSTDSTVKVAHQYSKKYGHEKVRVLALETNRGKGGAVRLGVLSSRGSLLLFADADGATKFSDIIKLEESLKDIIKCNYLQEPEKASEQLAIVIGSRSHLEEEAIASRTLFRTILMYGFHFLVWLFAVRGLKDTQCGFKVFTRKAARVCFESLHVERWAFDVELLYIAQTLKIPISEISVTWTEIEGSKVTPVWSWLQMGMDLGLIWLRYTIGAWKIKYTKVD